MLNNQDQKDQFKAVRKTVKTFFETSSADEASDLLMLMLDNFITNSEYDNVTKANAASLILQVQKATFQLERIVRQDEKNKKQPVTLKQLVTNN